MHVPLTYRGYRIATDGGANGAYVASQSFTVWFRSDTLEGLEQQIDEALEEA